ncbi:MAG: aminoglycoside phosphotransferase family protein [Daejeonella sp.]|nr:aminoglycoside phosphotransferase family protein [Daejeonella sp.]
MILDSKEEVITYLNQEGLINGDDDARVEHLSGGVSCRVWKISVNNDRWVIKQALEKLDVKADWFSDVERIHRELAVMKQLELVIPDSNIPKILHVDYVNHIYMMTCAEEGVQTWKECLMDGVFNADTAKSAADILSLIHRQSHKIDEQVKAGFSDQKYCIQLRIDPFHRFLINKYPELSAEINALIEELTEQKTCLVHGDFSPKNMLVEKSGRIVLIDYEVAHWGNPVFDLAYCLGHLMLKAWHLKKPAQILELINVFITNYKGQVSNLLPHLGLMLLARMDGKSPVNYIHDETLKQIIRTTAIDWIRGADSGFNVFDAIKKQF